MASTGSKMQQVDIVTDRVSFENQDGRIPKKFFKWEEGQKIPPARIEQAEGIRII